jgi:uncharacterized protein YcbK (DUF882 family)
MGKKNGKLKLSAISDREHMNAAEDGSRNLQVANLSKLKAIFSSCLKRDGYPSGI